MKIQIESMVDTQRLILMSQGEVFVWHIKQHLEKDDRGSKDITEGQVGCKICGKTVKDIFESEKGQYYKFMEEKYKE